MASSRASQNLCANFSPPKMKDFVLTEKLGQGTYANVYKGYKKGHVREVVAVKCIKKSSLSKTSSENLIREIEILKSLDHDHIVKLKDFQWDDENIFLILEYCSGGDLSTYIRRYKKLPEQVARKFLRQLALALQYIRARNISHMDLKPQNLLLESKDNLVLKVGDFGFAQYLLGKEGRDNLRGSPLYMAVEMFCSEAYDASVDIWSTGVILHETLFGYAPFASGTYEELELKIRSNQPIVIPSQPRISTQCRDLLVKTLKRDPKERIIFEEFFCHPFVDLEHAPRLECLNKAISIVTDAVKYDKEENYGKAMELYCTALEYFLPAIDFEKDAEKKAAIRLRVKQYINRAEQLKFLQKQVQKKKLQRRLSIETCAERLPGFTEVLKHAQQAEQFDDNREYGKALTEYYMGVELCMSILSTVPKSSETLKIVKTQAEQMMNRAEELTRYKNILNKENDMKSVTSCCIQ